MGQGASVLSDKHLELAEKLTSNEALGPNDPFWNSLLSSFYKTPQTREGVQGVASTIGVFNENLLVNNFYTGNVGALIYVFLERSLELKDSVHLEDRLFTWQSYNALFILRCILSDWVDRLDEAQLQAEFHSLPNLDNSKILYPPDILEAFVNRLVELLVDLPICDLTYHLYIEAINILLVLCSHQMFTGCLNYQKSTVYRILFSERCRIHAGLLVKRLLSNFVQRLPTPSTWFGQAEGGSFVLGIASSLWNAFSLRRGDANVVQESPLAELSLLLLLVLTNQAAPENPYRIALTTFSHSKDQAEVSPVHTSASFKLDYVPLYSAICDHLEDERVSLLLYMFLNEHNQFREFILSQERIEDLVVPILKVLYGTPSCGSHHVYMSLINLLILSENDDFNVAVHSRTLRNITWYTERALTEISLGGLMILVILRTVQYNIFKIRDKYLHSNCLATLANMASRFRGIHTYVAQRLVSFLESMSKRYAKQVNLVKHSMAINLESQEKGSSVSSEDSAHDLEATEEILRMVLETLNAVLYSQLSCNPNLVYALLYKKEVLDIFRKNPSFSEMTYNIETILSHFSQILSKAGDDLAVDSVMELVKSGAKELSRDRLKVLPELKFRYVEEQRPEEFFLPYVWSLVYQTTELYWEPSRIKLFLPERAEQS